MKRAKNKVTTVRLQELSKHLNLVQDDKPELDSEVVLVTPEMAEEWLATQTRNRRINKERVKAMVRDIKMGEWRLTGDTIKFDVDGELFDGQHRLTAVVDSGIAVKMLIASNCEKEAREVVDSGQSRTPQQALYIMGNDINKLQSSILTAMFGNLECVEPKGVTLSERAEAWEVLEDSIKFASIRSGPSPILSAGVRSIIARAHYCGEDAQKLGRFRDILDTGLSTNENDASIIPLRNLCLRSKRDLPSRSNIYSRTLKCLEGYLQGRTSTSLRLAKHQLWVIPMLDNRLEKTNKEE